MKTSSEPNALSDSRWAVSSEEARAASFSTTRMPRSLDGHIVERLLACALLLLVIRPVAHAPVQRPGSFSQAY